MCLEPQEPGKDTRPQPGGEPSPRGRAGSLFPEHEEAGEASRRGWDVVPRAHFSKMAQAALCRMHLREVGEQPGDRGSRPGEGQEAHLRGRP